MTEREWVINCWSDNALTGRRKITTDKREITTANVVDVVSEALAIHRINRGECQYLYDFYRGKQDIRNKVKQVRPEINNKVTVNRANEIVTFKTAYFLSEPIQYVSNGGETDVSDKVKKLNDFMVAEDKVSVDKEILDWMHICGVGVRMVTPDEQAEPNGSPLLIYSLDPREAFVIYYSGLGQKPLAGVIRQRDEDGQWFSCVYTTSFYCEIKGNKITEYKERPVPYIPIIEYVNNDARLGAFEIVIPLLNSINNIESNRLDDVEQFVNSILVFDNCEIDKEKMEQLKQSLGLMIKSVGDNQSKVYRVDGELSQAGAQTLVDDMYDTVLTITGMPNRNGGSSTSDTGRATIFRDGWQDAESRAEDTEKTFNRSERQFLKVALYICNNVAGLDLNVSDINIEHTRNNLSNMQSRMQILCEGLNNDKIHPKIPWIISGMPNAEEYYKISMEYYEQTQAELNKTLEEELRNDRHSESVSGSGQSDSVIERESNQEV